jgi:peptide deformylase
MIYKLIPSDSPSLKVKLPETSAEEIKEKYNLTLQELLDNLTGTMAATGGIGLSANQVGLPIRAFVMYTNLNEKKVTLYLNPKIVWESEETTMFSEGCLSYPFLFLNLKRPQSIKFTYTDIDGNIQKGGFTGLTARIFQHEYDHMEGKNFTELASKMKLEMAWKKAKKKIKNMKKVA